MKRPQGPLTRPGTTSPITLLMFALLLSAAARLDAAPDGEADGGADAKPPRVLVLLGKGFLASEFYEPYFALRAAGYEVDVASNAGRTVPGSIPFAGALPLENVEVDRYIAMFAPGGGSPKNLEKSAESTRIVKRFHEAGKLVTGLCHGSRLLMQADVINGRAFTGVWLIKDELPEAWRSYRFAAYVDEPTVRDGNLLTSRCPWDAEAFTAHLLDALADRGGPAAPRRKARVVVLGPERATKARMALTTSLRAFGVEVTLLAGDEVKRAESIPVERCHAMVLIPGGELGEAGGALARRFSKADRAVLELAEETTTDNDKLAKALRGLLDELPEAAPEDGEAEAPADAVLAIMPGFDGRTASAMAAWLRARHERVAIVAPEAGWVRGMNGTPLRAGYEYADPPPLADGARIVMPGGFWPHSEDQRDEQRRIEWVVARHADAKARLVALGLDSYELIRHSGKAFAGAAVTGTDQVDWAMRGKPVSFKLRRSVVHEPEHRLTTARGFDAVPKLWRVLEAAEGDADPDDDSLDRSPEHDRPSATGGG